jgi:hypothetical protein
MRSSVPDADLARIIDIAVTEKLQRVEAKRFPSGDEPCLRAGGRLPDSDRGAGAIALLGIAAEGTPERRSSSVNTHPE